MTFSSIRTALVVMLLAAPAAAQQAPEAPLRQISVTGEGRVETAPDMATITLGVTHQAKAARTAMDATSDAVARILGRMEELGIAARDMQTRNLSLHPVWSESYTSSGTRRGNQITGFAASNTVLVRVRDLAALGGILDAVIDDGANEFNGLEFSVQEPQPLEDEARKRAVADAMAKARLLAEAAGVTLGPVQSLNEMGGNRPVMMEMAAARASDSVPVAAGEVTLSASVSMVFAIE